MGLRVAATDYIQRGSGTVLCDYAAGALTLQYIGSNRLRFIAVCSTEPLGDSRARILQVAERGGLIKSV